MALVVQSLLPKLQDLTSLEVVDIPLTAEERCRVRRCLLTPDGLELHLLLPTGTILKPNQLLWVGEGRAYRVVAAVEEVLVIRATNIEQALRLGHFLGNMHRDIDVRGSEAMVLYDPVLEARLLKLGFRVERAYRPFLGSPPSGHAH